MQFGNEDTITKTETRYQAEVRQGNGWVAPFDERRHANEAQDDRDDLIQAGHADSDTRIVKVKREVSATRTLYRY